MKPEKYELSQEQLQQKFSYDPLTGVLYKKRASGLMVRVGTRSETRNGGAYLKTMFNKVQYPLHRLIWLLVYGETATCRIEHIDGDGLNNKLGNLTLNSAMVKTRKRSKTKPVWSGPKKKWIVKKGKETFEFRNIHLANRKANEVAAV